jgi:hypothetical protein
MTTTQQVQVLLNGTNTPINVSAANLSTDLNLKDFVVVVNGAIVPNTDYNKSSVTTILYSGPSLTSQSTIIRRKTPASQMHTVDYSKRISSNDWSDELDRLYRRVVEIELFGYNYLGGFIGSGNSVVNDQAFTVDWGADSTGVTSRKAVYNKLVAMDAATAALTATVNSLQSSTSSNTSSINSLASTVATLTTNQSTLQSTQTTQGNRITALENANLNETVVLARRSGGVNQSLTSSVLTTLIFPTEVVDVGNVYHDPSTGNITVPQTGWYEVTVAAYFSASTAIAQPSLGYLVNVTGNVNHELLGFVSVGTADGSANWTIQTQLTAGITYNVRALINATSPVLSGAPTAPSRLHIRRVD